MIARTFLSTMKQVYQICSSLLATLFIALIYLIRPMLGPMNICPYTIGCTQYAIMQLQEKPLAHAIKNIIERLIQCHPLGNRKS